MMFEWDAAKSAANASLRGLPFELAILLFDGPTLETVDSRKDYGEPRREPQDHQPAPRKQERTKCLS